MPDVNIIHNGQNYTLIASGDPDVTWLATHTGDHDEDVVLGRLTHHLPLGWYGLTLRERRSMVTPHIRASRLDAIQDLIVRSKVESDQRARRRSSQNASSNWS